MAHADYFLWVELGGTRTAGAVSVLLGATARAPLRNAAPLRFSLVPSAALCLDPKNFFGASKNSATHPPTHPRPHPFTLDPTHSP